MEMRSNDELICILGSIRHDWLNVLQLIKGNLAIGNQERAEAVLEEAVEQTTNESRLCNMGMPKTALVLLEQKWHQSAYEIAYEVDGPLLNLAKYDNAFSTCFARFFSLLSEWPQLDGPSSVFVTYTFFDQNCLIELDYQGHIYRNDSISNCFSEMPPSVVVDVTRQEQAGYTVTFLLDATASN